MSAFPRSCLSLSPIVSPYVWCARLPEVLSPLASACGQSSPTCVPVLDGVPTFLRSCPPLSAIFFPHACLCWSTFPRSCLPPVSHFLPTCVVPVVDGCLSLLWCIRFPEVLPPLVSQCLPISEPALEGASAIPKSCLLLSPIASPHVKFVLDACLSWSPHRCACIGWCVRLPEVCLPLSPIVSLHVCWVLDGVSAFPRSCLPLSPLVFHRLPHMCLCQMLRPPSRGLVSIVSHCLPTYVCLCWMVCPLVSPCFPLFPPYCGTRELALEGVFTFPRSRLPIVSPYIYLPLSPHRVPMPPIAFIVPHCSHCLPTCVPVDGGLAFLR